MGKDTADKQVDVAGSQPATAKKIRKASSDQAPEERWVQDCLEDDDVREALKSLHERDKSS